MYRNPFNYHVKADTFIFIFICYRRIDTQNITDRIYDNLVECFGNEACFQDVDKIPMGVDFRNYLKEQIKKTNIFLADYRTKMVGKK